MKMPADMIPNVHGFMKDRIMLTASELDLFTLLDKEPVPVEKLASDLELDERALTRTLDCLITFGVIEKHDDRYNTTEKGSYLSSRHPHSMLPLLRHANRLWNNWSHLTETVRKGKNPHLQPFGEDAASDKDRNAFIRTMHIRAQSLSDKIIEPYDLRPFKKLLDIGGGSGAYTIAFLQKNPKMEAIIFDLEPVIPIAREMVSKAQLEDRVHFAPGDYNRDELPSGCDLVLLSAIIHQNSPEENQTLYRKIYQSLEPGGVLLIRDHIMDETRTKPPGGALFALNMIVSTSGGDTYTFGEIKGQLEKAGFDNVKMIAEGENMDCLLESVKLQ